MWQKFCPECANLLTIDEQRIGYCTKCQLNREKALRNNHLCKLCGIHTEQKMINNKWVCKECMTEQ